MDKVVVMEGCHENRAMEVTMVAWAVAPPTTSQWPLCAPSVATVRDMTLELPLLHLLMSNGIPILVMARATYGYGEKW
jgi:hypothetical protein